MAVKTSCSYWTRLCHYTHKMAVKTSCSYRVKLCHYHPLHTEISSRCRAVFTCSLYVHCCFEKLLLLPTSSFMSRVMFLLCSVYPLHIHVAVFAVAQRLLVHDMPVFYQNCWRNQASFSQGDHLSQKNWKYLGILTAVWEISDIKSRWWKLLLTVYLGQCTVDYFWPYVTFLRILLLINSFWTLM